MFPPRAPVLTNCVVLPPALIQTEENDPLRDEGEAYARKPDATDVPVIATRYIGQIHDFGVLNGIRKVPSTQKAIHQASAVIGTAAGLACHLFSDFLSWISWKH